jgi:iron-sulfur cluster assembly protein
MSEPHVHPHPTEVAPSGGEPLVLTDLAIEHFRSVLQKENLGPEFGIRIAVNSGGCSGMSYAMDFESEARPDDTVLEQGGLKVYVDAQSAPYLEGVTVDYVVSLTKEGFKFINPKATRTCGCGESFGV